MERKLEKILMDKEAKKGKIFNMMLETEDGKTAKDAMELIEQVLDTIGEYGNGVSDDDIIGAYSKLIKARDLLDEEFGWISVDERLPEEPPEYVDDEDDLEEFIVMIDGATRPTTLRYAGDGTWWEDGTYYPVIAWRPLPEPYQPERSGE